MKKDFHILAAKVFSLLTLMLCFSCNPGEEKQEGKAKDSRSIKMFEILKPEHTGISFQNELKESLSMNGIVDNYYYNGAGVAVGDFNNDGLQDIYFLSTLSPNKLYLNRGEMQFEDVSAAAGLDVISGYQVGVATVDINADGWMDLYISNSGKFNRADDGVSEDPEIRKNKLFINQGPQQDGIPAFLEQSAQYKLDINLYSTQAAFLDYDHDGDLDMFLANHFPADYDVGDIQGLINTSSNLTGDRLYRNDDGIFTEVTKSSGLVSNGMTCDLGVAVGDLNNDGWPDVYVSNDLPGKDHLYMNNRDGSFTQHIDESIKHIPYASMGNDMADFNNDGWIDIFTLDMASEDNLRQKTSIKIMKSALYNALSNMGLHHQYMYNALQMNNGVQGPDQVPLFSEIAQMAGIPATDWSWGPLVFDMDNDGNKDLYIANGIKRDMINLDYIIFKNRQFKAFMEGQIDDQEYVNSIMEVMPDRLTADYFYRNRGDLTFEKMNGLWVEDLLSCNNGAAYADLDNDGDLDVVVNNSGGASFIYKNLARENKTGHYLQFSLQGDQKNPLGIGARIIVRQNEKTQILEQYLTRGFLSSSSAVLHLGCGEDATVSSVEIIWPDGKKQLLENVKSNQRLSLKYEEADLKQNYAYESAGPFRDITAQSGLNHLNSENDFDDFGREFMLPHRMSTQGPALATADVNGDGLEDVFTGGALGYSATLYLQKDKGFSKASSQPWLNEKNQEDVKAVFFDADQDGDPDLYVVSGGSEFQGGADEYGDRLYENDGKGSFTLSKDALPKIFVSGSCVEPGDFDMDGDLDLFVGGRQNPGRYPLPVSSYILRNDSEAGNLKFTDVSEAVAPMLSGLGMVTDATWVDIDATGTPDLFIVGEWMSPVILLNKDQLFVNHTSQSGLANEMGWWNCVTTADFDQDGDMDLVAGNLGLNYNFKASHKYPFTLFSSDFDNNGTRDIIPAYYNEGILYPWHGLMRSNFQLPFIKYRFQSYESFGKATMDDVYGAENLQDALKKFATNYASSYMENLGDGTFRIQALDNLAQVSPANAILSEDVDGDGHLDLILAGNFYGSESEITRADAGMGLWLKGDGTGTFLPVPAVKSGLYMDGDVRDALLIKLGESQQRALVSVKNNEKMQLYSFDK